jgi:hypothetical protein
VAAVSSPYIAGLDCTGTYHSMCLVCARLFAEVVVVFDFSSRGMCFCDSLAGQELLFCSWLQPELVYSALWFVTYCNKVSSVDAGVHSIVH